MGTKVWVTILIGTILCFGLLLAASASYGNWLPLTNIVFLLFAPLPIVLGGILKGNDTYGSQLSYVSLSMIPLPTKQTIAITHAPHLTHLSQCMGSSWYHARHSIGSIYSSIPYGTTTSWHSQAWCFSDDSWSFINHAHCWRTCCTIPCTRAVNDDGVNAHMKVPGLTPVQVIQQYI